MLVLLLLPLVLLLLLLPLLPPQLLSLLLVLPPLVMLLLSLLLLAAVAIRAGAATATYAQPTLRASISSVILAVSGLDLSVALPATLVVSDNGDDDGDERFWPLITVVVVFVGDGVGELCLRRLLVSCCAYSACSACVRASKQVSQCACVRA